MRYSNPQHPPAELAHEHARHWRAEKREFRQLLVVVTLLVVGLAVVLDRLALWAAPRIPFAWEESIAHTLHVDRLAASAMGAGGSSDEGRRQQLEAALQERLQRIGRAVQLPPEMHLTAHFVNAPTVNAFATLGGHITVFSGLLDKLEYEEELDAVLAHELGHVQHRHMVRQLSRGLTMAAALGLVGIRSPVLNRWLIGDAQQLQQLAYSRSAEREADATATQAAMALHGHTAGVERLFQRFGQMQAEGGHATGEWSVFLQSHPLPAERERTAHSASAAAAAGAAAAATNGAAGAAAPRLTPLPDMLHKR